MVDDPVLDEVDDYDVLHDYMDLGQELEDAAAAWHMNHRSTGQSAGRHAPKALKQLTESQSQSGYADFGTDTYKASRNPSKDDSTATSSSLSKAAGGEGAADAALADGLPQISKLLHDNPPCCNAGRGRGGTKKPKSSNSRNGPDVALSATAAVGGLVALTGSLLSYAVARARGSKREQQLKEGLRRKETALAAMQAELEALQVTATRMLELEAELKASNTHLLTMNDEVERARAASKRIEGDMALFQDQLYNLSTTEADIKAAMAVAEAKALQAEQRRQEAELQRRQAEARWKVAKQQLELTQTEVETLRGELGLRGSQLQGLTRELEFTRRQLANAEKSVERAQMKARSERTGMSSYDNTWD